MLIETRGQPGHGVVRSGGVARRWGRQREVRSPEIGKVHVFCE